MPDGVLNVVTTSRTGAVMEPMIRDPRLRKLTFTGSTPVGKALVEQSAEQLLRVSMELGGNAPFLVFGDADIDGRSTARCWPRCATSVRRARRRTGSWCTSRVAGEFSARLAERMGALSIGRGTRTASASAR